MNWTDGIILAILFLSVLIGLMRGLIAEVLSLVVWITAFWLASTFGADVGDLFQNTISLPMARVSLGYGICFFGVLLLGAILRYVTRRMLWSTGLSGIDRVLGVVFGLVRGALVVTLMVFLVGLTGLTRESWWQQSALLPQFQGAAAWLGQNIPASVADHLHPEQVIDKLKSAPVLQRQPAQPSSSPGKPSAPSMLDGLNSSAVTQQVGDLLNGLRGSTSGMRRAPAPAPASSAAGVDPADVDHAPAQPRHP